METKEIIFKRFVKCVNNNRNITVGNIYGILKEDDNTYFIFKDDGYIYYYEKELFIECDEQGVEIKKEGPTFKIGDYVYNIKDKYFDIVMEDKGFFINTETFGSNKNSRADNFRLATEEEINLYFN